MALEFETAHATDDILCTLSDQSRLFISAKRTCGDDNQLRDTLAQWVQQVDDLRPGDRLVLATAEPRGIVRHLGDALTRRRQATGTVYPAKDKAALDRLAEQLPQDKRDRILDAAVVLVVHADKPGNAQHDVASGLLEGTVVPAGAGVAALSHLETQLHTQAGTAYRGDVDSWVAYLVDRGVTVYADREGAPAAASRARTAAAERYRLALSAEAGQVDLTMLADDLSPLIVDDLVEQLRVAVPGGGRDQNESLLSVARRRTRLLVNGLPGAGKSAAMTQLAACWAGTPSAPLPILVRLRDLVRSGTMTVDVTVERLCEAAAARAPVAEQPELVEAMLGSVSRGEAVLLLDGLDECFDRRALVAEGLLRTVAALPADTGVVLTTRPSGVTAAARLAFDEVSLTTPTRLDAVLNQLLRHAADVRVAEADRPTWIAERARRVREITRAHQDMGSVPLLAVLTTLVVADHDDTPAPGDTAAVLHRAVEQTASRWERHRSQLPGAPSGPGERQLLDGFAAIGHLLSERAAATVIEVEAALSTVLTTRWGLAAGPTAEATEAIRRFWDDHVGVFVAGRDDRVVARSRVFAEIGAAMHSQRLPDDDLAKWVSAAVSDADRHNALLLAAQLDSRILDELLRPGDDADERTRLAAVALRGTPGQSDDRPGQLLDLLAAAAHRATPNAADSGTGPMAPTPSSSTRPSATQLIHGMAERRLRRDGPVWPWALEIARLVLPTALEHRRADVLAALELTEDQHQVAHGITALTSADAADRTLTNTERADVLGMLAVPLPPKAEIKQPSRRRLVLGSSVGLLDGLGQGTARAAARLPELGEEAIERITAIAPRASARDAHQIAAEMRRHGHVLQLTVMGANTRRLVAQTSEDLRSISRLLLDTVAALSSDDALLTAAQRWRLPILCDFLVLLDLGDVSVPDFRDVRRDPDPVRTLWLRLVALGAGLDLARLAAEARAALNEDATADHDQEPAPFELASVWPVTNDRSLDPGRISATDRSAAVRLLAAESDWIAHSAARLLWEAGAELGLAGEVADILTPELTVGRRLLVAALSCVLSLDRAAAAAAHFNSSDPARRRAAAMLASDVDGGRQLELLRVRALNDDDATVRIAAGAASFEEPGRPPPTYWSCPACGERNDPAEESCPACDEDPPAPPRA